MKTKTRILLYLILFAILDLVTPFPITAAVLIHVLINRPPWFKELTDEIYGGPPDA